MKIQSLRYKLILIIGTFLVSCEKVIEIDYNTAETKYVIEGTVSDLSSEVPTILISETKSFESSNNFEGVSGAVVSIQINDTSNYILSETSKGVYTTSAFKGIAGYTYDLTIQIGGQKFTSSSTLPAIKVALDTITTDNLSFGGGSNITIFPEFNDPPGKGNSYRYIQYVNGVQTKKVFVTDDELSDGIKISRPLRDQDGEIEVGDNVKVNLLHIDPAVYLYWYSLDQASTGNSNATPANPVSNIVGGALGYFSAHSISSYSIQVK